jgi:D-3-phosphoglycerate dehydrogenase
LNKINEIFSSHGINISSQYLQTNDTIGYVVMDVESDDVEELVGKIKEISGTIFTRVLY